MPSHRQLNLNIRDLIEEYARREAGRRAGTKEIKVKNPEIGPGEEE